MLFLVSKLVWLVIQPLSLAFLAGLGGMIALVLGGRRLALALQAIAGLVLFLTLYTTLGPLLLARLEAQVAKGPEPASLSCIIVLGGGFDAQVATARGSFDLNAAGDRYTEALRLAIRHPQARIVISGGDGSLSGALEGDALVARRFFAAFGIDESRLVLETTSRNTLENLANLKAGGMAGGDCLLITSAYHMPRALGLAAKAGLPVRPWPVDYRSTGDQGFRLDVTQPTLNSQMLATATREWTGLLFYRLSGRL